MNRSDIKAVKKRMLIKSVAGVSLLDLKRRENFVPSWIMTDDIGTTIL